MKLYWKIERMSSSLRASPNSRTTKVIKRCTKRLATKPPPQHALPASPRPSKSCLNNPCHGQPTSNRPTLHSHPHDRQNSSASERDGQDPHEGPALRRRAIACKLGSRTTGSRSRTTRGGVWATRRGGRTGAIDRTGRLFEDSISAAYTYRGSSRTAGAFEGKGAKDDSGGGKDDDEDEVEDDDGAGAPMVETAAHCDVAGGGCGAGVTGSPWWKTTPLLMPIGYDTHAHIASTRARLTRGG